jgi:hypothetical protein
MGYPEWGLLVLATVSFGTYAILLNYIERKHPQLWESLGRPTFMMSNLSVTYARFTLFLKSGEFLATSDWRISFLSIIIIISGSLFVITTLFYWFHGL